MRKLLAIIAVGSLLAIPLVGHVQQRPQSPVATQSTAIADLQRLVATQTEAIGALHAQLTALEERVKTLEEARPAAPGR